MGYSKTSTFIPKAYFRARLSSTWLVLAGILSSSALGFVKPHVHSDGSHHQHGAEKTLHPSLKNFVRHGFAPNPQISGAIKILMDEQSGEIQFVAGELGQFDIHPDASKDEQLETALEFIHQFLLTYEDEFQISPKNLKINQDATLMGKDEQFIRFNIHRNGFKIKDAEVLFRFKFGKLLQFINRSYSNAKVAQNLTQTTPEQALTQQLEWIHSQMELKSARKVAEEYRVDPQAIDGVYQLIPVARFEAESEDGELFSVEFMGTTQKVWELKNLHYNITAKVTAPVYPRYYKDQPVREALNFINIETDQGVIVSDENGSINEGGDTPPQLNGLKGLLVKSVPMRGPAISLEAELIDTTWALDIPFVERTEPWRDPVLAQVMAFQHTNKIIAKAKQYVESPWLEEPLRANVNHSRTCNAYWDGYSVNFFRGDSYCANTALIADVIYHEWGHGLDDNTGGIYDGAYSEGFGDILAVIMERSPILGKGFFARTGKGVRDLRENKIYPKDRGEVHDEGLIIGSTFWDLFTELSEVQGEDTAAEILANFAFKMIFTTSRYTDVYEALQVIDDDDADLSTPGPNFCALNRNFAAHGLARADKSCG